MRYSLSYAAIGAAFLLITSAACDSSSAVSNSSPPSQPAAAAPSAQSASANASATAEATELFSMRCTPCHGAAGAGDGAASAGLTPPPRNLQDPSWQSSVTDEHIEKIILYGGSAVGKSAAMPPNPDLGSKPDVVAALRAHIRGLVK